MVGEVDLNTPLDPNDPNDTRNVTKDDMKDFLGLGDGSEDTTIKEEINKEKEKTTNKEDSTNENKEVKEEKEDTSLVQEEIDLNILTKEEETNKEENDEDEEIPDGLNEKDAAAFAAMRKEISELKAKAKENTSAEEVETLQNELKELRSKVSAQDLTQDTEFQRVYDDPIRSKVDQIKSIVTAYEADPNTLIPSAAKMDIKDRKTLLLTEIPDAAPELSILFTELDSLQGNRQQALSNHAETQSRLQAQSSSKNEEAFKSVADSLVEKGYSPMMKSASDEKWNATVDARLTQAKQMMSTKDSNALAEMAIKASMVDQYQLIVNNLIAQVREANGTVSNARKLTPDINGSGGSSGGNSKAKIKERIAKGEMNIADAVMMS